MSHPVVHFEMWSSNPEGASRFYTRMFGWKINYTPELSYWLVDTGASIGADGIAGGINGGMFKPQGGPLPAKIALYVEVDDVGEYVRKAEAAGGKVLVPETEIPGVGWSAILLDPEQRAFGLFKPLPLEPVPARAAGVARKRPTKKGAAAAGRKRPTKRPRAAAPSRKRPTKKKR